MDVILYNLMTTAPEAVAKPDASKLNILAVSTKGNAPKTTKEKDKPVHAELKYYLRHQTRQN